jgi:hypothetical protein
MVLSFAMPRDRHTTTRIWNVCDGMRRRRFHQGGSAEAAVSSGACGCRRIDLGNFLGDRHGLERWVLSAPVKDRRDLSRWIF